MITLNGEPAELPGGVPLALIFERLGLELGARGVAVAIDGEVLPRAAWAGYRVAEHARVEVLRAMQGG